MSKEEKYKRYGYEDAYDTEKENNWTNRLNLDDCIEIMNNQFNEIVELKQQLAIIKRALLKASKEAFGKKASLVISNYPTKITCAEQYVEYLIFEVEKEIRNGN